MKRIVNRSTSVPKAMGICIVILGLTLAGCESKEVGSVKLPDVKDKSQIIPGFDPNVKSPYRAGAKKKAPQQSEADKALPANNHPSL